jgi:predicted membrane protein
MERMDKDYRGRSDRPRIVWGVLLFLIGAGLLLKNMALPFLLPHWLFTWPMVLIALGLLIGISHNFRSPLGFILILIGGANLANEIQPALMLHQYVWPAILILIGIILIFSPRRYCRNNHWGRHHQWRHQMRDQMRGQWRDEHTTGSVNTVSNEDMLDVASTFSGVRKVVLSKTFKGGRISSMFGGVDIDLTQADIQGEAVIEINVTMGGIKLVVPPHWQLRSEVSTVLGGMDDARPMPQGGFSADKILVLKGSVLMGGIEIRAY